VLDTDRWGRAIATCAVAGRDLGTAMIAAGWAVAFDRYLPAGHPYMDVEDKARAARHGVWRGPFARPWDWRRKD
jgi:endonuclease YncB( thermonuclease family)